jgi:UDP-glucose 4-epimerase
MEFKKALVTGGAGFIGSHLSQALLKRGLEVVVVDNLTTGKRENVPADAKFIEGDILDFNLVQRLISGTDIIFHEAARVSVRSSVKDFYQDAQNNIIGTLNLLQACTKSNVRKFVYASSMAVYADSSEAIPIKETYLTEPLSPYGIAKLTGEKYCLTISKELGIDCIVLRYFNTYGVRQTFTPYVGVITIFIHRLLAGKSPTIFGSGEQRRDFVHVGDVVDATLHAMDYTGASEIFNVGTGVGISVRELSSLLCSKINPSIKPSYTAKHSGEIKNSIADISKAKKTMNYNPRGKLQQLIDEMITWNRSKMSTK